MDRNRNDGWWIVIIFAMFWAFVIGLVNDEHEHATTAAESK